MNVGVLQAIAIEREQVYFGCVSYEAFLSNHGFYVTVKKTSDIEIRMLSELADHQPLQRIGSVEAFSFCLHHYVSSSSQQSTNWSLVTICFPNQCCLLDRMCQIPDWASPPSANSFKWPGQDCLVKHRQGVPDSWPGLLPLTQPDENSQDCLVKHRQDVPDSWL